MDKPQRASLAEIFARDPLGNSDQDIDEIIKYYRERAIHYFSGVKTKDAPINLEELGLI